MRTLVLDSECSREDWNKQVSRFLYPDEPIVDEEKEFPYGVDAYGREYTWEDVKSAHADDLYQSHKEGD